MACAGRDDAEKAQSVRTQLDRLNAAFEGPVPLFGQSQSGWRFANDLTHYAILTAYLAGDAGALDAHRARFSTAEMIDGRGRWNDDNPLYNRDGRPLIAEAETRLLEDAVSRRFFDAFLPYTDTVYIYRLVPAQRPGNDPVRRQYSVEHLSELHRQLADALAAEGGQALSVSERFERFVTIARDFDAPRVDLVYFDGLPEKNDFLAEQLCDEYDQARATLGSGFGDVECQAVEFDDGRQFLKRVGFFGITERQAERISRTVGTGFVTQIKSPRALPTSY